MKVLIIGGYGTFGGRLARLLGDDARFILCIGGRSLAKARAFCAAQPAAQAKLEPVAFDRDGDLAAQLAAIAPDVVVDASGPFQAYGDDPYRVLKACLARRIPYLDFADATGFVDGIVQFDDAARAAGIVLLSGVSSFPALSTAVLRRLSEGFARLSDVTMGIGPSPRAGIGINVIRVIAGYAGKRVALRRGGKAASGHALTEAMRVTIAPPGRLPLKRRWFSLVDAPDLVLVPKLWPDVQAVWTGAGTVPALWHRALNALAWLVRLRLLPSLSGLAPLFHWVSNTLVWGEHRGGMFVRASGADAAGRSTTRTWSMIAERDDGPFVPAIAAYVILRKWVAGQAPASGARACVNELELSDYEAVFERLRIVSGINQTGDPAWPLYKNYLGPVWEALPEPIRTLHDGTGTWRAEGRSLVQRGRGPIAWIAALIIGFPPSGDDVPLSVTFDSKNGRETWTRNFAGKAFASVQYEGRGRWDGLIVERFGPMAFAMALVLEGDKLKLVQRGWSFLGVPLPMFLAPSGDTYESAEDGRFNFHVEIGFPWLGSLVRYRGWLVRVS